MSSHAIGNGLLMVNKLVKRSETPPKIRIRRKKRRILMMRRRMRRPLSRRKSVRSRPNRISRSLRDPRVMLLRIQSVSVRHGRPRARVRARARARGKAPVVHTRIGMTTSLSLLAPPEWEASRVRCVSSKQLSQVYMDAEEEGR